jgi:hypothetical protein
MSHENFMNGGLKFRAKSERVEMRTGGLKDDVAGVDFLIAVAAVLDGSVRTQALDIAQQNASQMADELERLDKLLDIAMLSEGLVQETILRSCTALVPSFSDPFARAIYWLEIAVLDETNRSDLMNRALDEVADVQQLTAYKPFVVRFEDKAHIAMAASCFARSSNERKQALVLALRHLLCIHGDLDERLTWISWCVSELKPDQLADALGLAGDVGYSHYARDELLSCIVERIEAKLLDEAERHIQKLDRGDELAKTALNRRSWEEFTAVVDGWMEEVPAKSSESALTGAGRWLLGLAGRVVGIRSHVTPVGSAPATSEGSVTSANKPVITSRQSDDKTLGEKLYRLKFRLALSSISADTTIVDRLVGRAVYKPFKLLRYAQKAKGDPSIKKLLNRAVDLLRATSREQWYNNVTEDVGCLLSVCAADALLQLATDTLWTRRMSLSQVQMKP